MTCPLVSVLLSVYNGEQTIDKCLFSIMEQSYREMELICVDDCSTDSTAAILEKWQNKTGSHKIIIIRNEKNLGLTRSLNIAAACAKGKYFARIDADDTWMPDKIEKQISFLEKKRDIGLLGTAYVNVGEKEKYEIIPPRTPEEIERLIIKKNPFGHSCVVFRREVFERVGGYDENVKMGQDWDLWLRFYGNCKMANLQEILCVRNHSGISRTYQKKQMWQVIKTQAKYIKKYHYNKLNYLLMWEPLLLILIPEKVKNTIRRFCGL